jgi:hypothetical protein
MSYLAGPSAINLDLDDPAPADNARTAKRRADAESREPAPGGPAGSISSVDVDLT